MRRRQGRMSTELLTSRQTIVYGLEVCWLPPGDFGLARSEERHFLASVADWADARKLVETPF